MLSGGHFSSLFGPIAGTTFGSGMSLLFVFSGVLAILTGVIGYLIPAVRKVEDNEKAGETTISNNLDVKN